MEQTLTYMAPPGHPGDGPHGVGLLLGVRDVGQTLVDKAAPGVVLLLGEERYVGQILAAPGQPESVPRGIFLLSGEERCV